MSEKIKFNEVHRQTVGWAIMTAISKLSLDNPFFNMVSGAPLEVELKINGVEFNFSDIINRISEEASHWADKRAAEILKEKAQDIITPAEEMTREVTRFVKSKIHELFPGVDLE